MKKVSKTTIAQITESVLVQYPEARKADHVRGDDIDGFPIIAHYIVKDIEGADEFGFNDDLDSSEPGFELEITAITFTIHRETGRIFFWQYTQFGEPETSQGECSGEFRDGEMVYEFAANSELY